MNSKFIIKCYCGRNFDLKDENQFIACARCGFVLKKTIHEKKGVLEVLEPLYCSNLGGE